MTASGAYADITVVPRIAVRFPLVLPSPDHFEVSRPESWPDVTGRLEYVGGRLEYMPPCGEIQQRTAADVVTELNLWRRVHPGFVVGGNEAGMLLGEDVRAADAAVWRDEGRAQDGFARVAPVLAVEVAGIDDTSETLLEKARWYLAHGVETVWIVLPQSRTVQVVTASKVVEVGANASLPPPDALADLTPLVADFFRQLA